MENKENFITIEGWEYRISSISAKKLNFETNVLTVTREKGWFDSGLAFTDEISDKYCLNFVSDGRELYAYYEDKEEAQKIYDLIV